VALQKCPGGKASQNNGPTLLVHDCLVQNGQGKSVWWGPMACLGISVCVKHCLDFSFVFSSRPASLGHRSQITEGPVLTRFSYTKCAHARQNPVWSVLLWALLSLSDKWEIPPSILRYMWGKVVASGDERHQFFPLVVVLSMLQEVGRCSKHSQGS
jgi:hypothetical protein